MAMEWLREGEIGRPPKIIPLQEKQTFRLEWLEKTLITVLISIVGFMGAYTLNDINASIKDMHKDISYLQISYASLAKHVEDEDVTRRNYTPEKSQRHPGAYEQKESDYD